MPALLIPNISDDVFALLVEHAKKDGVSAGEEAARIVEKALPVSPPKPKTDCKELPVSAPDKSAAALSQEPKMSLVDFLMTMPEIEDEFLLRPRRLARGVPDDMFD